MKEKFVTVAQFSSYIEADLARQRLEDEGIDVVMTGENFASTYTGLPGIADVRLQTPESQAERARQLLEMKVDESEEDLEPDDFTDQDEDEFEEQE